MGCKQQLSTHQTLMSWPQLHHICHDLAEFNVACWDILCRCRFMAGSSLQRYEQVWRSTSLLERWFLQQKARDSEEIHGNPWKSMEIHGNPLLNDSFFEVLDFFFWWEQPSIQGIVHCQLCFPWWGVPWWGSCSWQSPPGDSWHETTSLTRTAIAVVTPGDLQSVWRLVNSHGGYTLFIPPKSPTYGNTISNIGWFWRLTHPHFWLVLWSNIK